MVIKVAFFTCTLVLFLVTAHAQKWSVQAGTAFVDYTYLYKLDNNDRLTQTRPAMHLQLNYRLKEKVSIGVSWDMSSAKSTIKQAGAYSHYLSSTIYGVLAAINYHYTTSSHWDLYSGCALGYGMGVSQWRYSDVPHQPVYTSSGLGCQLNMLTAAFYPVKPIGIYAHIGYGYSGVAGVGITGRF